MLNVGQMLARNCQGISRRSLLQIGACSALGRSLPGTVRPSMGSLVARLKGSQPGHWPPFLCIGPVCKVSGEQLRGQVAGVLGPARDPFRLDLYSLEDGVKVPQALQLPAEVNVD